MDEDGFLWKKDKHIPAKYYLQTVFCKDLSSWMGTDYMLLDYEVPDSFEESENESKTASVTESTAQNGDKSNQPTDEFGRALHTATTNRENTKPATITVDRASQTINPVSSLTGQTHLYSQNNRYDAYGSAYLNESVHGTTYAYGIYPQSQRLSQANYLSQPYQFQFQDNGEIMNIRQFNQLLKGVQRQTYSMLSSQLSLLS
jgi:hypothetical protein